MFIYTDFQYWDKLKQEVFTQQVHFDMSPTGGAVMDTTAEEIYQMWEEGFRGLNAVPLQLDWRGRKVLKQHDKRARSTLRDVG